MNYTILIISFILNIFSCQAQPQSTGHKELLTGAEQIDLYLPLVSGHNIALVVNQTSRVGNSHLVDTLLNQGLAIRKVFAPEHGFRGEADAGEKVKNSIDPTTNLPIISLYGDNKKPSSGQLKDIDIVIFDIQDVGARFYTYISTMHYMMEACAENGKKMIILDRPNPNGHYIDGPLLDPAFKSFVGMHPVPVVHGLTVGELALMINGEKWLEKGRECDLEVIKVKNYTHSTPYSLPVKPSPNLPNDQAIQLYPSLCFFEGTVMSIGRGTYFPFQVVGYPNEKFGDFNFTPHSIEGMAKSPKYEDEKCYGVDLRKADVPDQLDLDYLISYYQKFSALQASEKENISFFNNFFKLLAGTDQLQKQIASGLTEAMIRQSWAKELNNYKKIRKNYLLYPDFE